jgi:hypothetical protein
MTTPDNTDIAGWISVDGLIVLVIDRPAGDEPAPSKQLDRVAWPFLGRARRRP